MAASIGTDEDESTLVSELGTKQYWDDTYQRELKTFQDIGDSGDVWYGYDSIERILDWLDESPMVNTDSSVLDLGCGNGITLVEMHKQGYRKLTGTDYSDAAISLAKSLAEEEGVSIKYELGDILEDEFSSPCLKQQYDVCIDKGTYDAICLNPEEPLKQKQKYVTNVPKILKENGLLILTSCNWTLDELTEDLKKNFKVFEKIPTPTFKFGGRTGNRETCVVFQKLSAT